jgi:2-methylisocitrate lyase-like PEP mutase family enzyme
MKAAKKLRALLKQDDILITLGAYDALSAKIIEQAGIQAIYTSGSGISATHIGKPDAELYTMTENLNVVKNMVLTVDIPILADLDTGYGNAINVIRTVKEFEKAGCAGGVIEDQLAPKRCPAFVDAFDIIPLEEALGKIKAAVDAREDPEFLIVARTDALGQEAVDRANAYFEAGAELILFISKAFRSFQEMKKLAQNVKAPFCLNFFEDVHYPAWFQGEWKMADLKAIGVKLLNFPFAPLFAATHAVREVAVYIARHRTVQGLQHAPRISHEEFNHLIGFPELSALQTKYLPPSKAIRGK